MSVDLYSRISHFPYKRFFKKTHLQACCAFVLEAILFVLKSSPIPPFVAV